MKLCVREIPLTRGKSALVDGDDYHRLRNFKWHAWDSSSGVYYGRRWRAGSGKRRQILVALHHEVIGKPPKGREVDHINGNGLDNRKANLRFCSHAENMRNRKRDAGKLLPKGLRERHSKFQARITINGSLLTLGTFESVLQAVEAYNNASVKYRGEFGRLSEWAKETQIQS